VDGDGKLDIIFSVALLLNTSIDDIFHDNASQRSFEELCHQRGQYASFVVCVYVFLCTPLHLLFLCHSHIHI